MVFQPPSRDGGCIFIFLIFKRESDKSSLGGNISDLY